MGYREFVMAVGFLQEREVALKAGLAFEALDFCFHEGEVGGEIESCVVVEVDAVVWFAFSDVDSFVFH